MNRKLMASAVAVLICITMICVGFSAWVIILPVDPVSATGQFTVHTVQTKELAFDAEVAAETGKTNPIELGSDGGSYTYSWATINGTQDLDFTLKITLKPGGGAWGNWTQDTSAQFKIWLSDFQTLNDNDVEVDTNGDYLVKPTAKESAYVLVSYSGGAWNATLNGTPTGWGTPTFSSGVLTIPMSFSWGNAFSTQNPNQYFNSQSNYDYNHTVGKVVAGSFKTKADTLATIQKFSITVNGAWIETV